MKALMGSLPFVSGRLEPVVKGVDAHPEAYFKDIGPRRVAVAEIVPETQEIAAVVISTREQVDGEEAKIVLVERPAVIGQIVAGDVSERRAPVRLESCL